MMFVIGNAKIEERVAHEHFSCDLKQCKGACCTLPGGRGAPLEDYEPEQLQSVLPFVVKYLSQERRELIERDGFIEGAKGSLATTCVDDRDCIFVFYEDSVAYCAIERAFHRGEIGWRKPLSCHLFPVRIAPDGTMHLRYEKIPECAPARENGKKNGVQLPDFLRDALVRKFGQPWYEAFRQECLRRGTALVAPNADSPAGKQIPC